MTDPPNTLRGGGFVLRSYRVEDAAAVHEAVLESVEQVAPYETWCHRGHTLDEAAGYADGWRRAWEVGEAYYFAVLNGDRYLGSCGLCPVDQ